MALTKAEPLMRRTSAVYVEIPSFPPHTSRNVYQHLLHVSSTSDSRKENALFHSHNPHMSISTNSPKHKLDGDHHCVASEPPTKKLKQVQMHTSKSSEKTDALKPDGEFPNGFIYCHQCNRKRDVSISIHCTVKDSKDRRCRAKYCKACLRNRYGLALEDLLNKNKVKPSDAHIEGETYFTCPRCNDICNCVACRKAKGLQPTGNLANITRESGLDSAAAVLRQDPKALGSMAHRPKQGSGPLPSVKSKEHAKVKRTVSSSMKHTNGHAASYVKAKPKAKAVPKPVWTDLGTSLSLDEAEQRIHIRGFILRFSSIIEMSRAHLDELEEIRSYRIAEEELSPWISESCLKSLVLSLLGLLDEGEYGKQLKAVINCVKDSGANLNKVWGALSALRECVRDVSGRRLPGRIPRLPDPLPPPTSISLIKTRSGAKIQDDTGVTNVYRTAQLVPVISALVEAAMKSDAVKREIDDGLDEMKKKAKEAREAVRKENDLYEQAKASDQPQDKDQLSAQSHKRALAEIDDALKVALMGYVHRISPYGRDRDGRVYWTLSPGRKEIEAAIVDLESYTRKQSEVASAKAKRTRLVPSKEERSALKRWPWFLAVWGRAPPLTERTVVQDVNEDSGEDDEDEERWWGFWDPAEIRKLASWIRCKPDSGDTTTNGARGPKDYKETSGRSDRSDEDMQAGKITGNETESLAKMLEDYATMLECRIRRGS